MDHLKEGKPDDGDARSLFSMHELEPSPVEEQYPDLESGEYFPKVVDATSPKQDGTASHFSLPKLGLSGHRWDYWRTSLRCIEMH